MSAFYVCHGKVAGDGAGFNVEMTARTEDDRDAVLMPVRQPSARRLRAGNAPGAPGTAGKRIADGTLNANRGGKNGPLPADLRADDLAVYTIVSRVLLNLDETITKE
jgi:hypothetical protein